MTRTVDQEVANAEMQLELARIKQQMTCSDGNAHIWDDAGGEGAYKLHKCRNCPRIKRTPWEEFNKRYY